MTRSNEHSPCSRFNNARADGSPLSGDATGVDLNGDILAFRLSELSDGSMRLKSDAAVADTLTGRLSHCRI